MGILLANIAGLRDSRRRLFHPRWPGAADTGGDLVSWLAPSSSSKARCAAFSPSCSALRCCSSSSARRRRARSGAGPFLANGRAVPVRPRPLLPHLVGRHPAHYALVGAIAFLFAGCARAIARRCHDGAPVLTVGLERLRGCAAMLGQRGAQHAPTRSATWTEFAKAFGAPAAPSGSPRKSPRCGGHG